MARGYLHVLSEPGDTVTLDEFNDWYDNEHVPLRMANIPDFLTGARFTSTDTLRPSFLASYDISSTSLFTHDSYTKLRANRSPREAALVVRLETLDRRTAESLDSTGELPQEAEEVPRFRCTLVCAEEGDADTREMREVRGWRRSHKHRVYDSLLIGCGKEPKTNAALGYLVVHEFDDESYVDSDEFKNAAKGKIEVRRWELYKATKNTASTSCVF